MGARPNQNIYPDGGYFFIEADGARFRGESWRDLIAKVRAYREKNKRPIGDPESDVFSQYCSRIPSHCNQQRGPIPKHSLTFNQRVLKWFSNMMEWKRSGTIPRVTDQEAARRAAICARCPQQKALSASCDTCLNAVRQGRKAVLDGVPSLHQNLSPCAALGEDCQTTVHIEQPPVAAAIVPPECWRK